MSRRLTVLALTAATAAALLLAACGDDDSDEATSAESTECEEVEAPAAKNERLKAPPKSFEPSGSTAVFETSCGSFEVALDLERAPKTASSFAYLVERGFYDGTAFHRVAPGFVIQGGDPKGNGTGGPGYSVTEKPPGNLAYTDGIVAMAKTEAEPPGRSGSQFFVITAADAGLPPDYALVGEVSEGIETIEAIEALGTPGSDGPPSMPVIVESATIE